MNLLDLLDLDQSWKRFQVDYPDREFGNWKLSTFDIDRFDLHRAQIIVREGVERDPGWGTFTKLSQRTPEGWVLWMSDTRAEIQEHGPLFDTLWWHDRDNPRSQRLLVNGLGLGMAVHGALTFKGVEHIDVVEIDAELAEFMRPNFDPERVTIHVGNALEMTWPRGTTWDFAWHDIWPHITDNNLPEMAKLHRMYGHRVRWQDSWQKKGCQDMRGERGRRRFERQEKAGSDFWAQLAGFADTEALNAHFAALNAQLDQMQEASA